jgi:hypothetical protein
MTVCPFAAWKPVQNHGGRMGAHLGLIMHVQEGNGGLSGWFNNPTAKASSTWWVSKSGALEQYVDADVTAWAQGSGNGEYNSVETEGYVAEPLTPPQESMLTRLYDWGVATYHWQRALAEAPGQAGFGWHGMGGRSWGGHTGCPGDLRKNRRAAILTAQPMPLPTPPPPPPPAPPWPGRYLKYPPLMQGSDVHTWQAQMRARGWTIGIDGQYGPQSKDVCTQFQREKGLGVDGIVGPQTWNATWTSPIT